MYYPLTKHFKTPKNNKHIDKRQRKGMTFMSQRLHLYLYFFSNLFWYVKQIDLKHESWKST